MARNSRRKRDQICSHGVGNKLAELWRKLRVKVTSFDSVDVESVGRNSIEQWQFVEADAVDDRRASTATPSTWHDERPRRTRADRAPESPMPSETAAFD